MFHVRRSAVVLLALVALGQSGCVMLGVTAVGGSAVGVAWLAGRSTRTVDASVDTTAAAVESALRDLGLPVDDSRGGRTHAAIDSRLANGDPVMFDLDEESRPIPTDPARTRIGLRIGYFGDEKLAKRILDQVEERLRNPAAPAAPQTLPPPPQRTLESEEPPLAK